MKNYGVIDITQKIVGEIDPVGEFHEDEKRLANLGEFGILSIEIICRLIDVANNSSNQESVQRAKRMSLSYLSELKYRLSEIKELK